MSGGTGTALAAHRAGVLPGEVPLYYERFKPAVENAPVVVLVHGGALTGACYLSTADGRPGWAHRFVEHGFEVVVVDWPGVGRSGPVTGRPLTGELVCRCLGSLLDALGRPVTLLTHSMSGPYGFRLLQAHPDRVAALVAVAPGPPGDIQPEARIVRESDDEIEVRGLASRWVIPRHAPWQPSLPSLVEKMIGASTRFPRHAVDHYASLFLPVPARLVAERQNVHGSQLRVGRTGAFTGKPVLVITGSADTEHPRQADQLVADWLGDLGADVTFRFLDEPGFAGNGHLLMAEDNSDAIADEIAEWVRRCRTR
ncbi:alpha/beta fold hydrolase [Amycolatopsis sacchari]|uniref:alpha/beta fold hydrolase n=1 Tax=Amycolatopsis sacchari TaxID=115433 RepID=UPI003D719198